MNKLEDQFISSILLDKGYILGKQNVWKVPLSFHIGKEIDGVIKNK